MENNRNNFSSIFIAIIHEENRVIVIAWSDAILKIKCKSSIPSSHPQTSQLLFFFCLSRTSCLAADNIKYLFIVDDKSFDFLSPCSSHKISIEKSFKFQTWQLKFNFEFFVFQDFPRQRRKYFSAALIQIKSKNKKKKNKKRRMKWEFYVRKVSRQKHEITHFS